MRIAILDDDPSFVELLTSILTRAGHACDGFLHGKEIQRILLRESYDLLILDWHVPDLSGMDILHWLRQQEKSQMPVLFTTGRSAEQDIVAGLNAGADDYLVKPIRDKELLAKVKAILRRAYPTHTAEGNFDFGPYHFEPRSFVVRLHEEVVDLTPKEYELALLLFRNLGRPISRSHINDIIWTRMVETPSRALDTHLSRLRQKLQIIPENGFRLTPVYGFGYRLEPMGEEEN